MTALPAADRAMRLPRARRIVVAVLTIAAIARLAPAQDVAIDAPARVRGASVDAVHLLQELVARSATGRHLVAQLDRSDLVVYIRYEWFQALTLRGRIGVVAAHGQGRLFAIEVNSHQTRTEQLAALGHELQHAVEIAGAAAVHDARSLAALYRTIGEPSGYPGAETFETAAATQIGHRIRQELVAPALADTAGLRN
jgi:hypothetical protein